MLDMDAKYSAMPDALWKMLEPLVPRNSVGVRGGRPRLANRQILTGIMYRLRTGCQWKALPGEFGSGSTCHRRFAEWCQAGVFERIFAAMVRYYDRRRGLQLRWASLDSAMVKAPKGGPLLGPIRPIAPSLASNATC